MNIIVNKLPRVIYIVLLMFTCFFLIFLVENRCDVYERKLCKMYKSRYREIYKLLFSIVVSQMIVIRFIYEPYTIKESSCQKFGV